MPIKMIADCNISLHRSYTNGSYIMYIIKMCTFQDYTYGYVGQN